MKYRIVPPPGITSIFLRFCAAIGVMATLALSTARDYLRFAQTLANGGELDGMHLLSPGTVRLRRGDATARKLG